MSIPLCGHVVVECDPRTARDCPHGNSKQRRGSADRSLRELLDHVARPDTIRRTLVTLSWSAIRAPRAIARMVTASSAGGQRIGVCGNCSTTLPGRIRSAGRWSSGVSVRVSWLLATGFRVEAFRIFDLHGDVADGKALAQYPLDNVQGVSRVAALADARVQGSHARTG